MKLVYTNVVLKTYVSCTIPLQKLCYKVRDICYNPHKFSAAVWRHKKIKGCCLIFPNGQIIYNGCNNVLEGKTYVRQYVRLLQLAGYKVVLKKIHVVTKSALATLEHTLDYAKICEYTDAEYHPELLNACCFRREQVHFMCFHTGKIVITGIKSEKDLNLLVYPTLTEIAIFCES
jgi:transcription initiation factor TFIID TATA-box-binding protein